MLPRLLDEWASDPRKSQLVGIVLSATAVFLWLVAVMMAVGLVLRWW